MFSKVHCCGSMPWTRALDKEPIANSKILIWPPKHMWNDSFEYPKQYICCNECLQKYCGSKTYVTLSYLSHLLELFKIAYNECFQVANLLKGWQKSLCLVSFFIWQGPCLTAVNSLQKSVRKHCGKRRNRYFLSYFSLLNVSHAEAPKAVFIRKSQISLRMGWELATALWQQYCQEMASSQTNQSNNQCELSEQMFLKNWQ